MGGLDGFAEADLEVDAVEQGSGPVRLGAAEFELDSGGLAQDGGGGDNQEDSGGGFDREAEAVPPGLGNALEFDGGEVAEVDDDKAEAAAVKDKIGGFQCVLNVMVALDPEEAVQADAGGGGRGGVKRVTAVDDSAEFAGGGGGGERGVEEGGATGGAGPGDFGDGTAGQAGQNGV